MVLSAILAPHILALALAFAIRHLANRLPGREHERFHQSQDPKAMTRTVGRATPSAPGERSSWSSCSMGLDWRDGRNRAGYRLGGRAPDELASVVAFRR